MLWIRLIFVQTINSRAVFFVKGDGEAELLGLVLDEKTHLDVNDICNKSNKYRLINLQGKKGVIGIFSKAQIINHLNHIDDHEN